MFKKVLTCIMCLLMVFSCAVLSGFAAPGSISVSYNEMLSIISTGANSYLSMEDSSERYDKHMFISDLLKTDVGIDALILLIQNGDDAFLPGLGQHKDAMTLALCFIKSIPEEQRETALDDFLIKTEYPGLSSIQANGLKEVYEHLLDSEFRGMLEQTYSINQRVLLNLFSAVKNSFVLTDSKTDTKKIALKSINSDNGFKGKLENNVSQYFSTINGISTSNGENVLNSIISVVNSGATPSMIANYKAIFEALGMYQKLASSTSTPSGGGGGSGTIVYPAIVPSDSLVQPPYVPSPQVTAQTVEQLSNYNDVPSGHWYAPYVAELTQRDIFTGYDDDTFRPEDFITREETAVILVRILGLEERLNAEFDEFFSDNGDISEWAKKSVYLLIETGIFKGYDDGLFRPENTITRQELSVVIARALKKSEEIIGANFTDKEQIENWASEEITKAYSSGIIRGYEDNSFRPQNPISRAEAATVLYNFMFVENLL